MKIAAVTIDVEPDYPPILGDSRIGIEKALPRLMDLFHSESVPADIFLLAELCNHYPALPKEIVEKGFHLGNHGLSHRLLCLEDLSTQWRDVKESTRILHEASGLNVTAFRAPNFSFNGDTLRCLERGGYLVDSSILPGRRMKRGFFRSVYDFRGAPTSPYHAFVDDVRKHGNSPVLEIPVAANPETGQTPIGGGLLNSLGLAKALELVNAVSAMPVVLVIHPWEYVNLFEKFPSLPPWTRGGCREDFATLSEFIGCLKDGGWGFLSLEMIAREYRGSRKRTG